MPLLRKKTRKLKRYLKNLSTKSENISEHKKQHKIKFTLPSIRKISSHKKKFGNENIQSNEINNKYCLLIDLDHTLIHATGISSTQQQTFNSQSFKHLPTKHLLPKQHLQIPFPVHVFFEKVHYFGRFELKLQLELKYRLLN